MAKNKTTTELNTLVSSLAPPELEVYFWLRESFSIRWIAETAMLDKRQIKALAKKVYKTLQVRDQRELVAHYGTLSKEAVERKEDIQAEQLSCAIANYNALSAIK